MSSTLFSYGYLEAPYLVYSYGGQTEGLATSSQVEMVIANNEKQIKSQSERFILDFEKSLKSQSEKKITNRESLTKSEALQIIQDVGKPINYQVSRFLSKQKTVNTESEIKISGNEKDTFTQVDRVIANLEKSTLSEAYKFLSKTNDISSQVSREILESEKATGQQIKFGNVVHNLCEDGGYLALDYLTTPYLTTFICAHLRSQVNRKTTQEFFTLTQAQKKIDSSKSFKNQVQRQIADVLESTGTQAERSKQIEIKTQVRKALYNTTNLRILWEFPSRGDGTNWTSNSTHSGDYSPNNLNTDIVEQIWKSDDEVAGVFLTCDADNPIFVDTMAILNHNFTTSASVLFQGSNDPGFATPGVQINLNPTATNIFYIAPTLPTDSYRYWRISIDDTTNPAGFLTMGTVVFGSATIFQGECFVDRVMRSSIHFSDKIATEGFTNVANDRALKNATSLEFRSLRFNRGNYNNIREVFEEMRTSLKALWIPTPQYPSRFAVFGKLRDIPQETHNVKGEDLDFVDFQIEVDESL
jgi:hypothetical protein